MHRRFITVVETQIFARRAEKLLSVEERQELTAFLAANAEIGNEIPGTGGVRKLRFAAQGKGKSGGVRVIYYFFDADNPLYALLVYGKGEQADLTPDQTKMVASLAAAIKTAAKARRGT